MDSSICFPSSISANNLLVTSLKLVSSFKRVVLSFCNTLLLLSNDSIMFEIATSAFSYLSKYFLTGFKMLPNTPFLAKSTLLGSKSFICLSSSANFSPILSASFPPLEISTTLVANISFLDADFDMSAIPKLSKGFKMLSLS